MPFLDVNLGDVSEPKPVAAGRYLTQITKCDVVETGEKSKAPGTPQFRISIQIPSEPHSPGISHFITMPTGEDDESAEFKLLMFKRFLHAYGLPIPNGGFEMEQLAMEMTGAQAEVEVTLSDPDENGNVYNRLKLPKIREEAPQAGRRKR